ncbi:TIGR02099 family protein [Photobacterium sanctipauli]|uniref:TIGR02099 family protein n=1 Tax=Photobacterium sanctipauli TaxID=1342794 RepID=A0A2T3N9J4_9GAMM|nr:YhdP family protein [Photobacterium sanctipauli]PSW10209.1 TIGR02099 family protein [Photobacterium sanctipauli]
MTTVPVRLVRGLMWLVLILLILAAIAITGLRLFLPQLNDYREPIRQWASAQAGMQVDISHVEGHWLNFGPSLVLKDVGLTIPDNPDSLVEVGDVSMQLDMLGSVVRLNPVFKDIRIDQLRLDLTQLTGLSGDSGEREKRGQASTIERLEELLLVQLGQFSIRNSAVTLMSPAEEKITVNIEDLKWDTRSGQRRAEGVISIADTHFSQMRVIANLSDKHSLAALSGELYVQARNLSITPWLNKKQNTEANITSSNLNTEVWLTMERGRLLKSLLRLDNSYLRWQQGEEKHEFRIRQGLVSLEPILRDDGELGWRVDSDQMELQTDDQPWPAFDMAASWQPDGWQLAITQLSLSHLRPFISFMPDDSTAFEMVNTLQPAGVLRDIRVAADQQSSPRFSLALEQFGMAQWELLPAIHKLNAKVTGDLNGGKAVLSLRDDQLPYGEVFQAPLQIDQGDVTAYWQVGDDGWRLWSDHLTVSTPHLSADGQFRLDFPADAPSWLSFYGEATASKAGETWRYLPTLALGQSLTDYLSAAIRGGRAEHAQLLWYGELADFPYGGNNGIFQAYVPMRKGTFSFDTAWPELTDLDLDLLFENDFMYLDATHAKTMGATASQVTGDAELSSDGHLKLSIDVAAEGQQVRDYMMATPLVDSVGAALTTVQVSGPVTSSFQLDIPFDGSDVRAWGSAKLADNQVAIDTPPIPLEQVSGIIEFDNDIVTGDKLAANVLSQPITFGFAGNSVETGYKVGIDLGGKWQVAPLQAHLQDPLLAHVSGISQWQSKVDIDLHDTGFDYRVDLQAGLDDINSKLPYPLAHQAGKRDDILLTASGNAQSLTGLITAPDMKYQAMINLVPERLEIDASEWVVGTGRPQSLVKGNHALTINSPTLDADRWIELFSDIDEKIVESAQSDELTTMPVIPVPTRVNAQVRQLKLATLDWSRVDLAIRNQNKQWHILLGSREAKGEAFWPEGKPLSIALESLHLNIPDMVVPEKKETRKKYQPQRDIPPATEFDRSMMAKIPEMDITMDDAWLQGYRLGEVSGKVRRDGNTIELLNFTVDSGATSLNLDGHWTLSGDRNETQIAFDIDGENSSDLMGRFGISGGIQGAEFNTYASIQWQGAPWSMHRETLSGELKSETGQGVISDIGGAGRLLGLFSIDSIVRKMQLDFSGIFDDGLAFNYIRGSGHIENGRFETTDIKMQALAGDMFIQGSANLVNETVDARVRFIPDFTSGIPVLTAFAVAPQTAIYVFAISTALSPVLDVFTQVNYRVKGSIDSPVVTEQSRFTGEYTVPEDLKKQQ